MQLSVSCFVEKFFLESLLLRGQLDSRVSEHAQNATWLFYLVLQAEDSYCFSNVLNFSFPARYC